MPSFICASRSAIRKVLSTHLSCRPKQCSIQRRFAVLLLVWLAILPSAAVRAELFRVPGDGDDVVGYVSFVEANSDETLVDIARRYGVGYDAIRAANPGVDAWMPQNGAVVKLPHRTILPVAPHRGIVINAAEMRLYYFYPIRRGKPPEVEVHAVSIGRGDWNTPLTTTTVVRKVKDPSWYPPASIRREHASEGRPLPMRVPPGPDNPLGKYELRLGLPGYLIHGTNRVFGIGMQVTHGCVRMYPEGIEHLYHEVPVGTRVTIVNQPFKAGWSRGVLYLEVHPPLEGVRRDPTDMVKVLIEATRQHPNYPIDWDKVRQVAAAASGLPTAVGPQLDEIRPATTVAGEGASRG